MYLYHNLLIHSPADGHLGCFHVLDIVNCAVRNIWVHMSLSTLVSSVCMPSSGIIGSYGGFSLSFKESLYRLHSGCNNLHSHQQCSRVPFSSHPFQHLFVVCSFFDDGRSNQCEVVSHCSFVLYFSNKERY